MKLSIIIRFMRFHHYTSSNSFIRIWHSQKLLFGDPASVNDVLEQSREVSGSIWQYNTLRQIQQQSSKFRQISLTKDYSEKVLGCMSPMMWGHYGDKGNGVCIELEWSKLKIPQSVMHGDIKYVCGIPPTPKYPNTLLGASVQEIRKYLREEGQSIFFIKSKDWSYENEYRLVSDSKDSISIKGAIKRIIVYRWSTIESDIVLKLIDEHNRNIERSQQIEVCYLYRTEENGENIFKLMTLQEMKDKVERSKATRGKIIGINIIPKKDD